MHGKVYNKLDGGILPDKFFRAGIDIQVVSYHDHFCNNCFMAEQLNASAPPSGSQIDGLTELINFKFQF